jgi:uncharacterized membrane protein SpoIIM required for sporulation
MAGFLVDGARAAELAERERAALAELERLIARARRGGPRELGPDELERLPALARLALSVHARLEAAGGGGRAAEVRGLALEAHALLHRRPAPRAGALAAGLARFLLEDCPRTVREEWRLLLAVGVSFYGLALASGLAVAADLELAWSLYSPAFVEHEVRQLVETPAGEPFRGNFTFGLGASPRAAGWIMAHNMGVGVLFFAAGLIVPFYLLLVATNALMLGTYVGVASHWGQAGAISSILWCHGTLELQAILLAGLAGLVPLRGLVAPGPWTRAHALRLESARALRLLAPTFPLLFLSGLIEGFVSPHAPLGIRLVVIAASVVLLVAWFGFGGRRPAAAAAGSAPAEG